MSNCAKKFFQIIRPIGEGCIYPSLTFLSPVPQSFLIQCFSFIHVLFLLLHSMCLFWLCQNYNAVYYYLLNWWFQLISLEICIFAAILRQSQGLIAVAESWIWIVFYNRRQFCQQILISRRTEFCSVFRWTWWTGLPKGSHQLAQRVCANWIQL